MKSAEYVALVVGVYRAALDRAVADPDGFAVTPAEWATLEEAFSRGFTEGSLTGRRGEANDELPAAEQPRRPGRAGRARRRAACHRRARSRARRATTPSSSGPAAAVRPACRRHARREAGRRSACARRVPRVDRDRGARGAPATASSASRTPRCSTRRAAPSRGRRPHRAGRRRRAAPRRRAAASVSADARAAVTARRGPVVEEARTKRVTADEVVEHVGRLGGTRVLRRRRGRSTWTRARASGSPRCTRCAARPSRRSTKRGCAPGTERQRRSTRRRGRPPTALGRRRRSRRDARGRGRARCRGALGVPRGRAPRACCSPSLPPTRSQPLPAARRAAAAAHRARRRGRRRCCAGRSRRRRHVRQPRAPRGCSRSAASRVQADWGVNAVNPWTCERSRTVGAELVWASPELSGRQLAALAAALAAPGRCARVREDRAHGGRALRHRLACGDVRPGAVPRAGAGASPGALRDAKGYEFPVRTDAVGRTAPLQLGHARPLAGPRASCSPPGVAAVRLDLHAESPDEAARRSSHWRERARPSRSAAHGARRGPTSRRRPRPGTSTAACARRRGGYFDGDGSCVGRRPSPAVLVASPSGRPCTSPTSGRYACDVWPCPTRPSPKSQAYEVNSPAPGTASNKTASPVFGLGGLEVERDPVGAGAGSRLPAPDETTSVTDGSCGCTFVPAAGSWRDHLPASARSDDARS